jgi:hypothetical protein
LLAVVADKNARKEDVDTVGWLGLLTVVNCCLYDASSVQPKP